MKKTLIIVISIAIILAILVGLYFLLKKKPNQPSSTSNQTNTTTNEKPIVNENQQSNQNVINYTNSGFSPEKLTVKSGAVVTVRNNSNQNIQFNSNPHPTHTVNSELNIGIIKPGQSKTFTLTTKGTFGYHDHLNPSNTGTIIVE